MKDYVRAQRAPQTGKLLALSAFILLASCGTTPLATEIPATEPLSPALQSVCHLATVRQKLGSIKTYFNGSAVVYKEQYLITAAHNVYSPFYNPLVRLRVTCGKVAVGANDGIEIDLKAIRVAAGYSWTPKRYSRDFAVIRLPKPIAVDQPFSLAGVEGPFPSVTIAGFPGQKNDADGMNGKTMFSGSGAANRVKGRPFTVYDIETFTGNSGGPVWFETPTGPALVGIHISGGRARSIEKGSIAEIERMISELR